MCPWALPLAVVKMSDGGGAGREERCFFCGDCDPGRDPEGRGRDSELGRCEREARSVEGRADRERGACLLGSVYTDGSALGR
jgi:hypothetical protein